MALVVVGDRFQIILFMLCRGFIFKTEHFISGLGSYVYRGCAECGDGSAMPTLFHATNTLR